jgi:predicted aspartyl protease
MSTPYDRSYRPPFPALIVRLHSEDEWLGPFQALVDTGSDATLVPTHLLHEIGAAEGDLATIRSHFGETQPVQLYLVGFEFDNLLTPGIYVVADDKGDEIILGRDVLNKLPLFLDGPERLTDMLDDATVNRLRSRRKLA